VNLVYLSGFNLNHQSSDPAILDLNTESSTTPTADVTDSKFVSIDVSDTIKLQFSDQNSGGKTPETERRGSVEQNGSVHGAGVMVTIRKPGSLGRSPTLDSIAKVSDSLLLYFIIYFLFLIDIVF